MLSPTIDYILSLRDSGGGPVASHTQFQVIIPNFPPLTSINYSIMPVTGIFGYIVYELVFGEAMIPHAFDVKIRQGGDVLVDVIVSGRFTTIPISTFLFIGYRSPAIQVLPTNLRTLVNYYELTTFCLEIRSENNYNIIIDALRRMHTSIKSEQLAEQSKALLDRMTQPVRR